VDRLNYHHLYLFWTLAREGTFTKTAEKLSIAQSAVTSQIKSLEDTLGFQLVDRTNRRKPILTEEGKSVLEFSNSIFETGDELLKWAKQGTHQKDQVLRIGALSGLSRNLQFEFLKPILNLTNVRIEVITGDQDKLVRLLKEHHLDLILSSHNVPADGRITLHSNVLTTSPLVFVIAKGQKLKGGHIKDYLEKKPLCLPSRNFETRPEIDAFLDRHKFQNRILGEIDDIALLRIFAIKSKALVVIPEMGIQSEIDSGQVHVVARPKSLEQKFYVISRQKRSRNPISEMLIEKMRT
jgi:LysR family transcriptional regulator, transcriptional activator of nhaA